MWGATVFIVLRNAHTGEWMLPGGLYDSKVDASRSHTAARETVEEVAGVSERDSPAEGTRLLNRAVMRGLWSGPYGTPPYEPHMAFVLINDGRAMPSVDDLVHRFVPNHECAEIALVPLEGVDGNSLTVEDVYERTLSLRVRVGYARTTAMHAMLRGGLIPALPGDSSPGGGDPPGGGGGPGGGAGPPGGEPGNGASEGSEQPPQGGEAADTSRGTSSCVTLTLTTPDGDHTGASARNGAGLLSARLLGPTAGTRPGDDWAG